MRRYITVAFLLLIAAYAIFQGRFIIFGPEISIDSPKDEATLDAGPLVVSGTAKNVSFLSLDDRPIYTDESSHWEEKLIVLPGLNIIKLDSRDRFGREREKTIRVLAK